MKSLYRAAATSAVALLLPLSMPLYANVPGGGDEGPDVTLTDQGSSVVLDNGTVRATIIKANAKIASLLYQGVQMVATDRQVYFSMDGGSSYEQPSNCVYSVKTSTPEMADISLKHFYTTQPHRFDIDIHYVLRRGNSGLYVYAILDHPSQYGATSVGEWRMVWWMPHDATDFLMEKIYVDGLRNWQMPSVYDSQHAESTSIAEIILLTTGVRAGKYDSKYEYSVGYSDIGTYGHASDVNNVGAWLVFGSQEFFNDGPTKQDLAPASGIIRARLGERSPDCFRPAQAGGLRRRGMDRPRPAGQRWQLAVRIEALPKLGARGRQRKLRDSQHPARHLYTLLIRDRGGG